MKKILLVLLALGFVSSVSASEKKAQLFNCMDASFTVDAKCMEQQISNNIAFKESQSNFFKQAGEQSGREIATISFYPEQFLIEVVAHKSESGDSNLVASNSL